jgi:hypothetical protein
MEIGSKQSPAINNSGGVAILFDSSYFCEVIRKDSHKNGRICSLSPKKNKEKFLFINIYTPNDNYQMISFIEELDEYMLRAEHFCTID